MHLGDTHHASGHIQAARDAWQQALEALDELNHPDTEQIHGKLRDLDDGHTRQPLPPGPHRPPLRPQG